MLPVPLPGWLGAAVLLTALSIWKNKCAFLLIAVLAALNTHIQTPSVPCEQQRSMKYSGTVIAEHVYESYTALHLQLDKVIESTREIPIAVTAVHYTHGSGTYLGKRLEIHGRLQCPKRPHRPAIVQGHIDAINDGSILFWRPIARLREWIHRHMESHLQNDHRVLGLGLILGGSGRLASDLRDVFARAGVLHILAVSGLHVGFIALFIGIILFLVPLPRHIKFLVTMGALFMYAGVTGFRPSVCRAVLMIFLFTLSTIVQRNVSRIHIVNIAAILFLLVQPLLLFDIGAQLSFAAVYGILYLYPAINRRYLHHSSKYIRRYLLAPISVSFSAQLFVSPLLLYYFHRLPILAPLSNVFVVPLAALSIFLLFLSLFAALVSGALAHIIVQVASWMLAALIMIAKIFASLPFSTISLHLPPVFIGIFFIFFAKSLRRPAFYVTLLILILHSLSLLNQSIMIADTDSATLVTTTSNKRFLVVREPARMSHLSQLVSEKEARGSTYLIAPPECHLTGAEFIEMPDRFCLKRLALGDLVITITDTTSIIYQNTLITIPPTTEPEQEIRYSLTNGRKIFRITAPLYRSIIDQIVVDAKLLFYKLLCLF